ncbi:VOC family protein [Chengkuizengella sp. 2205SS18-9]|uniref:VOC family protein n=2 Tax=Chengkuizengella axinellae TaxID=3064388 RepID=A0ABT9J312_9BACL|nr:VOC family protein [Chengkuizengella sp. 2205SS18-9]MDP5275978.1 VOC family protein [Chengkuizengella sp. 2205SS18-9]
MHEFKGIDHVQLAAPKNCEDKTRHFYEDILGMEEIPKPEKLRVRGGVWFQCGIHEVHIGVQEDFHPAKKAHPGFEVKNVLELGAHLKAQGIEIKVDETRNDVTRFFVNDPFGNRLEFLEWN